MLTLARVQLIASQVSRSKSRQNKTSRSPISEVYLSWQTMCRLIMLCFYCRTRTKTRNVTHNALFRRSFQNLIIQSPRCQERGRETQHTQTFVCRSPFFFVCDPGAAGDFLTQKRHFVARSVVVDGGTIHGLYYCLNVRFGSRRCMHLGLADPGRVYANSPCPATQPEH
jgi:hypothetical protein